MSRKSTEHLPKFYNTVSNKKFLHSTLDQLIQPGVVEKINGYVGKKNTKNFNNKDYYLPDISNERQHKQLESACVILNDMDSVDFYKDYNDYINGLKNKNADVTNQDRLNKSAYYPWEPYINWDKLINYHQYFWLPDGPPNIHIDNIGPEHSCTNVISFNNGFEFSSYSGINPTLTLYRNVKYKFKVNTNNIPFSIRETSDNYYNWLPNVRYEEDAIIIHTNKLYKCNQTHISNFEFSTEFWELFNNLENNISIQHISNGIMEVVLDDTTPDILFYVNDSSDAAGGMIIVKDFEDRILNVENDLIGKLNYTIDDSTNLSNGMKLKFGNNVIPKKYRESEWLVTGVGYSINLINYDDLCVQCDTISKDYITIEIGANDGNLWSKNNRWYHQSVIEASYKYNNSNIIIDQTSRAKRPIIEFKPNLRLFNYGTVLKHQVDLVDDFTSNIFKSIESSQGYNIDGVSLTDGMHVLFTNDKSHKNKIYKIQIIPMGDSQSISLIELPNSTVEINHNIYAKSGDKYGETVVWLSENGWQFAQLKTSVNQEPLFMVYDSDGVELSDTKKYAFSNFNGTKLFSYKKDEHSIDSILGFGIKYQSIQNTGNIIFSFDFNNQTFTYKNEDEKNITKSINDNSTLREYNSLYTYSTMNGYINANASSKQAVCREFLAEDGQQTYELDVFAGNINKKDYNVKIYKNTEFMDDDQYTINTTENQHIIAFDEELNEFDNILIKIYSDTAIKSDELYEIPINLENNPSNEALYYLTYSEITNHLRTIAENAPNFKGNIPGNNNLRDLGKISQYGTKIIKHSAPLNIIMYNMLSDNDNLLNAINYTKLEYNKFKREFINLASTLELNGTLKENVDFILKELNSNKTRFSSFYFSDMVPYNAPIVNTFTIKQHNQKYFPISEVYHTDRLHSRAINVYLNDVQLILNKDYTFGEDAFLILDVGKKKGDILAIYEYFSTNGSYIPPTPTKLGLFPSSIPEIIEDDTYLEPQNIIIGHDGSSIIAYNDFRDDLVLELEKRIFNNIKIGYDHTRININDYIPGAYRNTGISKTKLEHTLLEDFNKWSQFTTETYSTNNIYQENIPFTYNYVNAILHDNKIVSGTWKNIYQYVYDTITPHKTPWEMLGFTKKPTWWESTYGSAPYTSNNLVLWRDLENGVIREPSNTRVVELYKRPKLTYHLPVNDTGALLDPISSNLIKTINNDEISSNFSYGDGSPIEMAWRNTSDYRFSLINALILNFPAEIFSKMFDVSRQKYNNNILQYNNTDFSAKNIIFPSDSNSNTQIYSSGLINFIRDAYSTEKNTIYNAYKFNLQRVENRLGTKLAGFTAKEKLNVSFDSKNPSISDSLHIPPENYKIFLNKSTPIKTQNYSGIIIEKHNDGFTINGYDIANPTFIYNKPVERPDDKDVNVGGISEPFVIWEIHKTYSIGNIVKYQNKFYRVTKYHTTDSKFNMEYYATLPYLPIIGGVTSKFRSTFTEEEQSIEYGTILKTTQDVVDFILGHECHLSNKGFAFEGKDAEGNLQTWTLAAREFLWWTTLSEYSAIAISPGSNSLNVKSSYSVLQALNKDNDVNILQADGSVLNSNTITIDRSEINNISLTCNSSENGIYGTSLEFVQKEHVLLLDNFTEFNDIIYNQITGFRQPRLKINGYRTVNWDGSLNIPGFLYDQGTVTKWMPWKKYTVGETVKYKEFYYSAKENIHGEEVFDIEKWILLNNKPESKLLPNLEYKINQFEDFYSLDTNNFDVEQQKFAQHLIGYQPRKYLQNIITDDVSQYKLYQGFIAEKGTKDAITNMFNSFSDTISIEEEWAIKTGQYGAVRGLNAIEFNLSKCGLDPQPLLITNDNKNRSLTTKYFSYKDVYTDYTNKKLLPTKNNTNYTLINSGIPNIDYVDFIIDEKTELFDKTIRKNEYIWNTNSLGWDVLTQYFTEIIITEVLDNSIAYELTLRVNNHITLRVNDIISIKNNVDLDGTYEIIKIEDDIITVRTNGKVHKISTGNCFANVILYKSCKFDSIRSANDNISNNTRQFTKLWIDDGTTNWKFIENNNKFSFVNYTENEPISPSELTSKLTIYSDSNNTKFVLGRPDDGNGKVYVYFKKSYSSNYEVSQIIQPRNDNLNYGDNVLLTNDNKFIIITHSTATVDNNISAGLIEIHKRSKTGKYEFYKQITSNTIIQEEEFGNKVYLHEKNNIHTLYILSKRPNGGKITIYQEGTFDGIYYDWESIIDKRYKGKFDPAIGYQDSDIILSNGTLYQAEMNIPPYPDISYGNWSVYNLQSNIHDTIQTSDFYNYISNGDDTYQIASIKLNEMGELIISFFSSSNVDGVVVIFKNINGLYEPIQKLTDNTAEFGYALSEHNGILCISSTTKYSNNNKIYVYKKYNGSYVLIQTINSPEWNTFGRYGIKLQQSDNLLAVSSEYGIPFEYITFDDNKTTFDNNFCNFMLSNEIKGAVNLYQKIDDNYIYSQSINYNNYRNVNFNVSYLINDNILHVGDIHTTGVKNQCIINEYKLNNLLWNVKGKYKPTVDIDAIKNITLYDSTTNTIKQELDYVDLFQGKTLNIAMEQLSYVTKNDPAIYLMGDDSLVNVDPSACWLEKNVGKLWWDLSTSKFRYPYQGNIIYSANNWNSEIGTADTTVYEWTESEFKPAEWDKYSEKRTGKYAHLTGKTKYGDNVYSTRKKYDPITKTFTTYYYYWVGNKLTTQDNKLSANNIATIIKNPTSMGLRYVSLISPTEFALHNCNDIIDENTVLRIQYWTDVSYKHSNIHTEYKLIKEHSNKKIINTAIENKWIDSLVGRDAHGRYVPDTDLNDEMKYGTLNNPRQSWFINQTEALKQYIHRVNSILHKTPIVNHKNITKLFEKEQYPSIDDNLYDISTDTLYELKFVNVYSFESPKVKLYTENGNVIAISITKPGSGYITPPTINIIGSGSGAEFNVTLNSSGGLGKIDVISPGQYYNDSDKIVIRNFSTLVMSDESRQNKWAIYEYIPQHKKWSLKNLQTYNVQEYWDYADWYANGYDSNTNVNYLLENINELYSNDIADNTIIKIKNIGSGGWELFNRISSTEIHSIGKENGTIVFKESLYDPDKFRISYDSISYDSSPYDIWPYIEIRIILETLKNNILIDDLLPEYNDLFFSSIRYVLSEDTQVDWIFKTSFINIKYYSGELSPKITYKIDNSSYYESYINEVKPYKTKIREYITSYDRTDVSNVFTCDFDIEKSAFHKDNPTPTYNNGNIQLDDNIDYTLWQNNGGFSIKNIYVSSTEGTYDYPPTVEIIGECVTPAQANLILTDDSTNTISHIEMVDEGAGYLKSPTVNIIYEGSTLDILTKAVLYDSNWKLTHSKIKFDRVGTTVLYDNSIVTETFDINHNDTNIILKWPMDLKRNTIEVAYNGYEILGSYSYDNIIDHSKSYTRELGNIKLNFTPEDDSTLIVKYKRNTNIMYASDRIYNYYDQKNGQYAKNISTLMAGVTFKGIQLVGGDFLDSYHWGGTPWMIKQWDLENKNPLVEKFKYDGNNTFELAREIEAGEVKNIYVDDVRIDDENYGTAAQSNPDAVMESVTVNSACYVTSLNGITLFDTSSPPAIGAEIKIIDSVSDGSDEYDKDVYDSIISGGDLDYTNALETENGVIYDGATFDGINQPGPEELVTGTISESYYIKIYEQSSSGTIYSWSYFNDNQNKTHYKRIKETTELLADLEKDSTEITLKDNITGNDTTIASDIPGIIFINGERIEYYSKNNNVLSDLVRGTYGTGIPDISDADTKVIEQSNSHLLPYTDTVEKNTHVFTDKYIFMLPYIVEDTNNVEVFIEGRKLRKLGIDMYDPDKSLDSPEADYFKGPEFTVITTPGYDSFSLDSIEYSMSPDLIDFDSFSLLELHKQHLDIIPEHGNVITVVKKKGEYFHSDGLPFEGSSSDVATFIKS